MGNLNDFENYSFTKSNYYKIKYPSLLYDMTDKRTRFEYLLYENDYSWYCVYDKLSSSDKDRVIEAFSELNLFEFNDNNIVENINKWSSIEFFINLDILSKYQYAIALIDLENYSSKNKEFNRVNNDYPLDAAEKSLVLYLIGKHKWSDIHVDNKQDIFDYFDKKCDTVEDMGAILEALGYDVVYKKDGGFTAYW